MKRRWRTWLIDNGIVEDEVAGFDDTDVYPGFLCEPVQQKSVLVVQWVA